MPNFGALKPALMNDKYSLAKCAQYGRRLATRLCEQHFGHQPNAALDGPALLKLTPIRQVNLLIVRQLLTQWQVETAQLRSSYFDFEAPPVQAALTQFMNLLSRHIRVGRPALEPLLAHAVADTLGLVIDPVGSFQRLLLPDPNPPTREALRENLRYLDVDRDFYTGFVASLPPTGELARDFVEHRFELYQAANYKAHQPLQQLVDAFTPLLPLTVADLREDGPVAPAPAPIAEPVVASPKPVREPEPTPAPVASAPPVAAKSVEPKTEPKAEPKAESEAEPAPLTATPVASPSTPAAPPQPVAADAPLYEKLKANTASAPGLAETLRAGAESSARLSDRNAPKVETLRDAISINQRFSFINELFNGENMEYHAAVQHLDSLPSAEAARAYVTTDLAARYDWGRKEEHVNKLLKLVDRKFA